MVEKDESAAGERASHQITEPTTSQRKANFRGLGHHVSRQFEALREVHEELSPAAVRLDDVENSMKRVNLLMKRVGPGQGLSTLRETLDAVLQEARTHRDVVRGVWEATKEYSWGPEFTVEFSEGLLRPKREPIFHSSVLASMVSAFESFLGHLAREYYISRPEGLYKPLKKKDGGDGFSGTVQSGGDKEFSLQDLQKFGSIQEAIDHSVESRVEALGYFSLGQWREFFGDRLQIDMRDVGPGWETALEIFERRHCLVHNDGRASERYRRMTGSSAELLDPVLPDAEYLSGAFDALHATAIELLVMVWAKFEGDEEPSEWLTSTAFESLRNERWILAHHLFERRRRFPMTRESEQITQVNLWIAEKGIGGVEAISSSVESWDLSGLDRRFEFAKHCLLDELDAAFAMLPSLIEREEISDGDLATWPLVQPLRRDPRIRDYGDRLQASMIARAEVADGDEGSDSGMKKTVDGAE